MNSTSKKPDMDEGWYQLLEKEFHTANMDRLRQFLKEEISRYTIYPAMKDVFNAFKTPLEKIKVVVLGQDPYHNPRQAHGLCFSVQPGIKPPPSVINIFKEIESDLKITLKKSHGDLSSWSQQGVFLLNSVLTVRQNQPGSHRNQGWEVFTDEAIRLLSEKREHLVFLLWGSFAHQKESLIDSRRHLVLKAPHPSPFSADRGFFGCRHFSQTNQYLEHQGKEPIHWESVDR